MIAQWAVLIVALQGAVGAVITVGAQTFSAADVAARAAELGPNPTAEAVVESLVVEALLAQEARRSGTAAAPEAVAAVERNVATVLADAFVRREIAAKIVPTEDQLKALFHKNGDKLRLSLVVLATKEEAQAALGRLQRGGDFLAEASRSLHASAAQKGDTGLVERSSFEEPLANAAIASALGQYVGPLAVKNGWAIAKVVEKSIADEKGLAAERSLLTAIIRRDATSFQRRHHLAVARKNRRVTVDEPWLLSLGKRVQLSPEESRHPIATIDGRPVRYLLIAADVEGAATGPMGAHAFGPPLRIQLAQKRVDSLLLAAAARDAGLDRDPEVKAALIVAEDAALGRFEAQRFVGALPPAMPGADRLKAHEKRVSQLRKSIGVQVDMAAAKAAISPTR